MAIAIGDKIPAFRLPDQDGHIFDSQSLVGRQVVVLYFYPKDFTPGCTKEACTFRDHYRDFANLGAAVIGVSSDTVKSHQKFSVKHKLPFTLLSDKNQELRKKLGIKKQLFKLIPGRETLVIDKNGILQFRYSQLNANQHCKEALEFVSALYDRN